MTKKRYLTHSLYTQFASEATAAPSETFVYFLIEESPTNIYSREYSEVYEMLQSLFGDDLIPEDEAVEAIKTAGLKDPESILSWMTRHHYLHRAALEEVLK